MTTPDLMLSKAALTAALIRQDPIALSRNAMDEFVTVINKTLNECSRPHVQECKNWIVANIVPSNGRTTLLAKFLAALSDSMDRDVKRPSVKKRRLHILYIVNDVLHHVVVRQGNRAFGIAWSAQLPAMITAAAFFDNCPRHLAKVNDLIALWAEKDYLPAGILDRLRSAFRSASNKSSGFPLHPSDGPPPPANDGAHTRSAFHGYASVPWHGQPAASWLPQLAWGATMPVRPQAICRLELELARGNDEYVEDLEESVRSASDHLQRREASDLSRATTGALGDPVISISYQFTVSFAFPDECRSASKSAEKLIPPPWSQP
ncbi:hypothetical protein RJ55_04757 [Drechmeria coniospora]|nr:hypothetical protein RJ55_04757 [Drechmeria coniospora]